MKSTKFLAVCMTAGFLALISGPVIAAPTAAPTFKEALADFNANKNKEALAKFEAIDKVGPTNMTVHYYKGVCYQRLGKTSQAKLEFKYVAQYGDAAIKPYAVKALAALENHGGNEWANLPAIGTPGSFLSVSDPVKTPTMKVAPPPPGQGYH